MSGCRFGSGWRAPFDGSGLSRLATTPPSTGRCLRIWRQPLDGFDCMDGAWTLPLMRWRASIGPPCLEGAPLHADDVHRMCADRVAHTCVQVGVDSDISEDIVSDLEATCNRYCRAGQVVQRQDGRTTRCSGSCPSTLGWTPSASQEHRSGVHFEHLIGL